MSLKHAFCSIHCIDRDHYERTGSIVAFDSGKKLSRMKNEAPRLHVIDGLRGIAILMVVLICHYIGDRVGVVNAGETEPETLLGAAIDLSITGVHLFFIISGFLLGGILIDNRGSDHFFLPFYIRRLNRIFPLYFGCLLMFLIISPQLDERFDWLTKEELPAWTYAIFMQNNAMAMADHFGGNWLAPTWSLAVEEQFYIILPFLIFFTPPRLLRWVLLAAVIVAPLLRAVAGLGVSGTASIVLLTSCMDALCYGILAAHLIRTERGRRLVRTYAGVLGQMAWLLPLSALLIAYYGDALDIGARVIGSFWLMTTGFTALLLYITQKRSGCLHRLLDMAWLRWIGVRCYAIYLFHQAVIGLMGGYLVGRSDFVVTDAWSLGVWLAAIAAILTLAAVSWHLIERPMIALGHRWTYRSAKGESKPAEHGEPARA
jgi:peptidoglycan/LPS O-acetylase OafA/YrhL